MAYNKQDIRHGQENISKQHDFAAEECLLSKIVMGGTRNAIRQI